MSFSFWGVFQVKALHFFGAYLNIRIYFLNTDATMLKCQPVPFPMSIGTFATYHLCWYFLVGNIHVVDKPKWGICSQNPSHLLYIRDFFLTTQFFFGILKVTKGSPNFSIVEGQLSTVFSPSQVAHVLYSVPFHSSQAFCSRRRGRASAGFSHVSYCHASSFLENKAHG